MNPNIVRHKVLLISSEYPPGPGGIGQHAYCLVKSLVNLGYQMMVISPADYTEKIVVDEFDRNQHHDVYRYSQLPLLKYFIRIFQIYQLIQRNSVRQVILTGKFSIWMGIFIKIFLRGVRTMVVLHGSEVNLRNRLFRRLTHYGISCADQLVAVSAFTRSIVPQYIRDRKKIEIIPNGIEQSETKKEHILEKMDLRGFPRLLTVGHMSPRKGQHRVIKALPTLIKQFPTIHYHIVGRSINQVKLMQLASDLGVIEYVSFHGVVKNHDDLSAFYLSSDIFMLLSENQSNGDVEGFGIVALEANAYGVPVIGAMYCGVEDAVKDGFSGYLVDGDQSDEIKMAIIQCLDRKEQLKDESIIWAKQHNWGSIIEKYNTLLE